VGADRACAVDDGRLLCWGAFSGGTPQPVQGFSDVGTVAIGKTHLCAALRSGHIRCAGKNDRGQLGTENIVNVTFNVVGSMNGAFEITAGDYATCTVTRGIDSELVCWGLRRR
jgi:alpha-tubulin suppressor-like RCC1 family protein